SAALIVERPESLVLDQRTADDRPELVSPQSILGIARGAGRDAKIEKVILRVEFVIAQKLEQGAMQAVSAALHRHADHRPAAEAVFGRISVGLDPELLQRLHRRYEVRDMDARIFGVGSIETDHLKRLADAVGADGKAGARNWKSTQTVAAPSAIAELHAGH